MTRLLELLPLTALSAVALAMGWHEAGERLRHLTRNNRLYDDDAPTPGDRSYGITRRPTMDTLPGMPDLPHQPATEPAETISTDRRRTIRQRDALAAGRHPIGLLLGIPIKLHPDAAPADDRKAAGLRCGGCVFREVNAWGYGKCTRSNATTSHSAASDNRAWWPACTHHQPTGDAA